MVRTKLPSSSTTALKHGGKMIRHIAKKKGIPAQVPSNEPSTSSSSSSSSSSPKKKKTSRFVKGMSWTTNQCDKMGAKIMIQKAPMKALIKGLLNNMSPHLRISSEAVDRLHEVAESYMHELYEKAALYAFHAKRITLNPDDLKLSQMFLAAKWDLGDDIVMNDYLHNNLDPAMKFKWKITGLPFNKRKKLMRQRKQRKEVDISEAEEEEEEEEEECESESEEAPPPPKKKKSKIMTVVKPDDKPKKEKKKKKKKKTIPTTSYGKVITSAPVPKPITYRKPTKFMEKHKESTTCAKHTPVSTLAQTSSDDIQTINMADLIDTVTETPTNADKQASCVCHKDDDQGHWLDDQGIRIVNEAVDSVVKELQQQQHQPEEVVAVQEQVTVVATNNDDDATTPPATPGTVQVDATTLEQPPPPSQDGYSLGTPPQTPDMSLDTVTNTPVEEEEEESTVNDDPGTPGLQDEREEEIDAVRSASQHIFANMVGTCTATPLEVTAVLNEEEMAEISTVNLEHDILETLPTEEETAQLVDNLPEEDVPPVKPKKSTRKSRSRSTRKRR